MGTPHTPHGTHDRTRWQGLRPLAALALACAVATGTAGTAGCSAVAATTSRAVDTAAPRALYGTEWTWTDDDGHPVRLRDLRGHLVVLAMFLRRCEFVCPPTLARMHTLDTELAAQGVDARFVLVSLDPRNDTPERLHAFRTAHGMAPTRWTLLVGDMAQTEALSRLLTVGRVEDDDHIDHVARIMVVSPDGGRMRTFQGWDFTATQAMEGMIPGHTPRVLARADIP